MATVPLVLCVFPTVGQNQARAVNYPDYVDEVLAHAGVFHNKVPLSQLEAALDSAKILLTVGEAKLPDSLKQKLTGWIESGGAWISIAGVCEMDAVLGASRQPPDMWSWGGGLRSLGEGYLSKTDESHVILGAVTRPIHFFGGLTVVAKGARILAKVNDKHGRETDHPAILENQAGKGRTILIAPDVTGTIVRIQQGVCVTRDGVPAPDGSAPVDDWVLKSGDGSVLDWLLDRDPVPGVENYKAYLEPMADAWRQIVLRAIFHAARDQDVALPVLWMYPRKLGALAHMSHDTDSNDIAKGHRLVELLDEGGIKSTWCVILPGYDANLISKIRSAGHELATHYDAMTEGTHWSEQEWDEQHKKLVEMFDGERPVTNKNHYTRWEGDTEWWEWCAKRGIQLDQSKGASKTGEAGYNFGTCHVYLPVTFRGKPIDCFELCTCTQDLHVFAPVPLFEALLAAVKRHHGIFHQLFHPAHVMKQEVADALLMVIRRAKEEGMEWWTGRQINGWERARRTVKLEKLSSESLTFSAASELVDATILLFNGKHSVNGSAMTAWGFEFSATVQTLAANQSTTVSWDHERVKP